MSASAPAAPALPASAAPGPHWGRLTLVLAAMLVALWIMLPRLASTHPLTIFASLRWPLVGLALLAQLAAQGGRGHLVRVIVDSPQGHMGWRRATLIVVGAAGIGLLGGGFPGYVAALYRWMRTAHVSVAAAVTAGSLPSLLSNLMIASITVGAATIVSGRYGLTGVEWAAVSLGLLTASLTLGSAWWLAHDRDSLARWFGRLLRLWARVRRQPRTPEHEAADEHRIDAAWQILHRPMWRPLLLTALGIAGCDVLSVWALLAAAHQSTSLEVACFAWGVPQLLGNISMLPGGVGVIELTMLPVLERVGVASGPALAVVLSYRLLSFWLPLLAGAPIILWLERRP